jgi:hypothetical protein
MNVQVRNSFIEVMSRGEQRLCDATRRTQSEGAAQRRFPSEEDATTGGGEAQLPGLTTNAGTTLTENTCTANSFSGCSVGGPDNFPGAGMLGGLSGLFSQTPQPDFILIHLKYFKDDEIRDILRL